MKLVVGLGNPGRRYQNTRHNVGYVVLSAVAKRFGREGVRSRFQGEVVEAEFNGTRALLLSPLTYMNRSGASVQEALRFYKIPREDLLVICDDINLPVAQMRLRGKGSSGGQKGLEDIIRRLGNEDFARLRIGVGTPPDGWDWADYVLGKFNKEEATQIEQAVASAVDAVSVWAQEGIDVCMNRYN